MPFPASHPALERALSERGYEEPTSVQAAVLSEEAAGRDLLVSAQTGSGKTVAFGLAMAPTLLGEAERFAEFGAPVALVIAPTRELALQVNAELTWLYAPAGGRIVSCVGGMDARAERRQLDRGCHIVVGTPGRLKDHIDRGGLDLSALKVVVLDEADEMLDLGFSEDLTAILSAAPQERRTLLFSATIAKDIAQLARTYQKDALRVDTTTKNEPHGDIAYKAMRVAPNQIEHAVVNVLRFHEAPGALVFCNTREGVNRMQASLRERGFSVAALSGELSQRERADALQALRDGHARVCVATDVAARGLDLPDLGLVIHADVPVNKATLLHRSGRTGRAGKKGLSVVLVTHTRRRRAESMFHAAHIEAEWSGPPSADAIREKDRQRMLTDPVLTAPAGEEDIALGRALIEAVGAEQAAGALMRLFRERLPAPEEIEDDHRMKRDQAGDTRPPKAMRDHSAFSSGGGDSGWFRLSIGRSKNADPKWLLPVICRLGDVTRDDIGAIRVFDDETRVEIAAKAIEGFSASIVGKSEKGVTIELSSAPQARDFNAAKKAFRAKPPFKRRTDAESAEFKPWANKGSDGENAPAEKKPWAGKPRAEKPWTPKPEGAGKKSWAGKSAARPAEDRPRKPRPDGAPGKHKAPWQAKPYAGKSPKAKKPRG